MNHDAPTISADLGEYNHARRLEPETNYLSLQ